MAILKDLKQYTERGQKFTGVFYREHETRKHGLNKDKQIILRYTIAGETKAEAFGWLSEGMTAQDAQNKIKTFRANHKHGEGPTSLSEEKQAKVKAQNAAKAENSRRNTTFSQFFEEVYFPQAKLDKAEGSWKTEDRLYRLWIKPVISDLTFEQISIEHLNKIKENMTTGKRAKIKKHPRDKKKSAKDAHKKRNPARPLSATSINYALAVIRQTWNLAVAVKPPLAQGAWPGASKAFKKPKVDNLRKRFLTVNEATLLLSVLKKKSEDVHDIALLSLHCGMRAGEIFNLTWDKVNLKKGELLLVDTKNGESRIAYLTDPAKDMLRKRSVDCKNQRLVFISHTSDKSKQIQFKQVPATFSRTVKELKFNEGVNDNRDKVVFHTLRHTYASWLVDENISLPIIRDLLGHKNLIMTSRYSHTSAKEQKFAVANFNKKFNPSQKEAVILDEHRKMKEA